jgi:hypothetical protein
VYRMTSSPWTKKKTSSRSRNDLLLGHLVQA